MGMRSNPTWPRAAVPSTTELSFQRNPCRHFRNASWPNRNENVDSNYRAFQEATDLSLLSRLGPERMPLAFNFVREVLVGRQVSRVLSQNWSPRLKVNNDQAAVVLIGNELIDVLSVLRQMFFDASFLWNSTVAALVLRTERRKATRVIQNGNRLSTNEQESGYGFN